MAWFAIRLGSAGKSTAKLNPLGNSAACAPCAAGSAFLVQSQDTRQRPAHHTLPPTIFHTFSANQTPPRLRSWPIGPAAECGASFTVLARPAGIEPAAPRLGG